jgi:hypothetical protein
LYCVGDPFSEIENEFLNFSTNYDKICLLGDFNARTAEEPDFVETNYDEFKPGKFISFTSSVFVSTKNKIS